MHFHYALFADILSHLAETVAGMPQDDVTHREALCDGAAALNRALQASGVRSGTTSKTR
jgi:hypothetical protein